MESFVKFFFGFLVSVFDLVVGRLPFRVTSGFVVVVLYPWQCIWTGPGIETLHFLYLWADVSASLLLPYEFLASLFFWRIVTLQLHRDI